MKRVLLILFLMNPFYLKGQTIKITDYKNSEGSLYWGGTIFFSAINSTTLTATAMVWRKFNN